MLSEPEVSRWPPAAGGEPPDPPFFGALRAVGRDKGEVFALKCGGLLSSFHGEMRVKKLLFY